MKSNKCFILIFLFLFFVRTTMGLGQDTEIKEKNNKNNKSEAEKSSSESKEKQDSFLQAILKDEVEIFTSPFRMKGTDWLVWGSVALITGILIANDEVIYQNIKDYQNNHEWVDRISPVATKLGDGFVNLGIAGGFYLGGLILKNGKAIDTARLLVMTFVHTGIVVQFVKHLTGRQRPSYEDGKDYWYGPSGFFERYVGDISKYDAFPSGHTITAWGTATVISEMYKDTVFVPVLCYSLATLVGFSRITEDTHWISDVFLGAVLGYAIGKFVVRKRSRKWEVIPVVDSDRLGLGLLHIF
jgi:membrane-associated phospholipid phosphatase